MYCPTTTTNPRTFINNKYRVMEFESIYNLLPKENIVTKKKSLLKKSEDASEEKVLIGSTFGCSGTTRLIGAGKLQKKNFGVFGPPKSISKFAEVIPQQQNAAYERSHRLPSRLPKVPSKEETPIFGLKSTKDFVKLNAVEAMLNVPRNHRVEPDYLKKEDYGKVPAYLKAIANEIDKEKDLVKRHLDETFHDDFGKIGTMQELSDEDRSSLLQSLKFKWAELNSEYQKTAHLVELDTLHKKKRKEVLEHQLEVIEKDMFKLEGSKKIFIKN